MASITGEDRLAAVAGRPESRTVRGEDSDPRSAKDRSGVAAYLVNLPRAQAKWPVLGNPDPTFIGVCGSAGQEDRTGREGLQHSEVRVDRPKLGSGAWEPIDVLATPVERQEGEEIPFKEFVVQQPRHPSVDVGPGCEVAVIAEQQRAAVDSLVIHRMLCRPDDQVGEDVSQGRVAKPEALGA